MLSDLGRTARRLGSARRVVRAALAALVAAGLLLPCLPAPRPLLAAPPATPPGAASTSYADIDGHWARPEIEALRARGALPRSGEFFRPDEPVTRGEFLADLVRALGYGPEAAALAGHPPPFSDAGAGETITGHLSAGVEHALVRGYPDGTFRADREITRAEISTILVRLSGLAPDAPGLAALPFTDRSDVPSWAAGYIAVAYQRGMIRGYPDGSFRPESGATRAEAACLIYRAVRLSGRLFDLTGLVREGPGSGDSFAVDLWPAGTPGSYVEEDGTLVVPLPDSLGPSPPGPTVRVRISSSCVTYRDGRPAALSAVRPFDQVSLILDETGAVAFIEALRPDGVGLVTGVGPGLAWVALTSLGGDGPERVFAILPWAPVLPAGPGERAPVPGDLVYFILDSASGAIRALALIGPGAGASAGPAAGFSADPAAGAFTGPAATTGPDVTTSEVIDPAAAPPPLLTPAAAMALSAAAVNAPALRTLTGASGRGVTIAIVDTGVDVSHPDLAMTSAWERKIVDWRDFSGEGDVSTTRISTADAVGMIQTDIGPAKVTGIVSQSGFYHSGVFSESQLQPGGPLGGDLDRNGRTGDRFLVVAVDRRLSGVYDTVYVDTNRNLDLTDEVPLRPYRDTALVAWFGDAGRPRSERCSFVLADIRSDGNRVTLGFDGNGHGTHVAAISSAYGSYRGGLDGLAPGTRVMALKALRSSGDGTWGDIVRAVSYAAQKGAEIIVLSVANLSHGGDLSAETAAIAAVAARYGVLIVSAAGNTGPGVGTARGLGASPGILTVGAALDQAMWQAYFSYAVEGRTVWPFSAVGPRPDLSGGPDVLAPGCALSAAPLWLEPPGYVQSEGTSMAAPHVAGVAALLLEALRQTGRPAPVSLVSLVEEAILAGARPLEGYSFVEQGRGAVDALRSWEWLAGPAAATGSGAAPRPRGTLGLTPKGVYDRDGSSARVLAELTARAPGLPAWLDLSAAEPWVVAERPKLALPVGLPRSVGLSLRPDGEGLHSTLLVGSQGLAELVSLPVTVVVPVEFSAASGWRISEEGVLGPARLDRCFFRVPPGASALEVSFGVADAGGGNHAGRVRLFLYGPDSHLAAATGYVGQGTSDGFASLVLEEPAAGVWEAVVYSSAALSAFGLEHSHYWLEAALSGVVYDLSGAGWEVTVASPSVSRVRADLPLVNIGDAFEVALEGFGLWPRAWDPRPEAVTLGSGETLLRVLPPLEGRSGLLRVQLCNVHAEAWDESEPPPDLDLTVFQRTDTGWREFARSSAPGVRQEIVEIVDPPGGEYAVQVTASGGAGWVSFELRSQWLPAGGQVTPVVSQLILPAGARRPVAVVVSVPTGEGARLGALRLRDRTGSFDLRGGLSDTVSLLPLTVRRTAQSIRVVLSQTSLEPGPNLLTFRVLTADGVPVARFVLETGGHRYEAAGGLVTVPWPAADEPGPARVWVRTVLPDGTGSRWLFHLPVVLTQPGERGSRPLGPGAPAWLEAEGFRPPELDELRELFDTALAGGVS
ncbi:MAG: S8 family serine peptidase [Bacillota bacterium]